jgi:hypothetical protein
MTHDEIVLSMQRVLFEQGPLSVNELKQHIGKVSHKRLAFVLTNHPEIFDVVGWLKKPSTPPQHIWGLLGTNQSLVSETPKKHPFDVPKHSVIYRDMVAQQRIKYDRY